MPRRRQEEKSLIVKMKTNNDKNEHLKRPGQKHTPLFKSRLVARGDLEQSYSDIRTDSPTAEVEAFNILLAWCAAWMLKICSIDITNAYFHGMILDRLMLLRPPRGGLPDKSNTRRFHDVGTCAYLRHQRRWKKVLGKAEESPNRHWTTPVRTLDYTRIPSAEHFSPTRKMETSR